MLMEGVQCNCEIAERLGISLSLVSHHLRILREAGLVRGQRDPMRGWFAPKLFSMRPTYALGVDIPLQSSVVVRTRIEPVRDEYFPGLRILFRGY